jgi:hypothetical protein
MVSGTFIAATELFIRWEEYNINVKLDKCLSRIESNEELEP